MKRIILATAVAMMSTSAFAFDNIQAVYNEFTGTSDVNHADYVEAPTLGDPITLTIDQETGYITAAGHGTNVETYITAVNTGLFSGVEGSEGLATKWIDGVISEATSIALGTSETETTIAAWVEDFNNEGDTLDDGQSGYKTSVTDYENSTFNSAIDHLKGIDTYNVENTDFSGTSTTVTSD